MFIYLHLYISIATYIYTHTHTHACICINYDHVPLLYKTFSWIKTQTLNMAVGHGSAPSGPFFHTGLLHNSPLLEHCHSSGFLTFWNVACFFLSQDLYMITTMLFSICLADLYLFFRSYFGAADYKNGHNSLSLLDLHFLTCDCSSFQGRVEFLSPALASALAMWLTLKGMLCLSWAGASAGVVGFCLLSQNPTIIVWFQLRPFQTSQSQPTWNWPPSHKEAYLRFEPGPDLQNLSINSHTCKQW